MTKYYLNDGKEVLFGDLISCVTKKEDTTIKFYGNLNNDTILFLVDNGMLTVKDEPEITMLTIIDSIIKRTGILKSGLYVTVTTLTTINPVLYANLLLKEIAILMNKKYNDDYRKLDKLYGVSMIDFSIVEIIPNENIIWENVALFRSSDDAKLALSIIFNEDKN